MATSLIGAVLDRQGVARRAGAPAAAADQGHADGVVLGRMDGGTRDARQGRGRGDSAGIFQKVTSCARPFCAGHRHTPGKERWLRSILSVAESHTDRNMPATIV